MVTAPTWGEARNAATTWASIGRPATGSSALVDTVRPERSGSGPGRLPARTIAGDGAGIRARVGAVNGRLPRPAPGGARSHRAGHRPLPPAPPTCRARTTLTE